MTPGNNFPDPRNYHFPDWVQIGKYYFNAVDILSFGDELTVENVIEAYSKGIFPWHIEGLPLPWFCPEVRAVLDFDDLRVPRSLAKAYRNTRFTFTVDKAFREVITACAETTRAHEAGTWITGEFIDVYTELNGIGEAHSVEVWDGDELAGGLYGVDAGGVFCGESMFYRRSNASKFALLHLIDLLKARGADWLDIQVMTPHFEVLGAKEISREEFLERLSDGRSRGTRLFG
jgi:leucyl/phenylalanyl-tRNA--protein transferase